jgi:uncharacterized protein YbbC (DUF1343 family)
LRPFIPFLSIFLAAPISIAAIPHALSSQPRPPSRKNAGARVKTGIDVLEEQKFAPLRGKHVGLITNQTGVDAAGRRTIDILAHVRGVSLVAIFSPEHGLVGREDSRVASTTDSATGLPVFSLYGETQRPTHDMLKGIDTLVFDIQDAGVRFYTFITTMAYAMEEATKQHIAFYVLDRPDPLDGETIEGPMLDRDRLSFVGYFPMPVRYAMTLGELAQMFNAENKIGADLHVIEMKRWRRSERFEATGLTWIPPSPNLRTLNATLLYPGIEILQAGGISVGRGTPAPFEIFGAPWIEADKLADNLNRRNVAGVRFAPAHFTPASGIYQAQSCGGVSLTIADPGALRSMTMGLEIASTLTKMYPEEFHLEKIIELLGSASTVARLQKGDSPAAIVASWAGDLAAFRKMRDNYLLYPAK